LTAGAEVDDSVSRMHEVSGKGNAGESGDRDIQGPAQAADLPPGGSQLPRAEGEVQPKARSVRRQDRSDEEKRGGKVGSKSKFYPFFFLCEVC